MTENLTDKDRWLAAEFALGVLSAADMRNAENRYDNDQDFRDIVDGWQNQLNHMNEDIEPVKPSDLVWNRIEQKIGPETAPQISGHNSSQKSGFWDSLSFLRGFSVLSGGLAAASIAALLFLPTKGMLVSEEPLQPLIATLTSTGNAPNFVARFDPGAAKLIIRASYRQAESKVPELWLIPEDGVPRSLGTLSEAGLGSLSVSEEFKALFNSQATLAVTMEPQGGAPEGVPTGAIIASGKMRLF